MYGERNLWVNLLLLTWDFFIRIPAPSKGGSKRVIFKRYFTDEKNISTQRPETQAHSRVPCPHGNCQGPSGHQPPSCQRAQALGSLINRCRPWGNSVPVATYSKTSRLLTSADYAYVFDSAGYKLSHRHYLILARHTASGQARLGLVVAKKNIRLATRRNRIKRVVRETFRKTRFRLDSLDIIFLARKGFDTLRPAMQTSLLEDAWVTLAKRSGDVP